ncbi:SDR family oxidoreductase [Marinibaculum pumilum]|uniref:Peroxisomal trans-2-enoyl-CoA reductase n=1 Tax=Marinibaculum pumilum TaxID=1766165 RepID=A0ABV7KTD4_9PROT
MFRDDLLRDERILVTGGGGDLGRAMAARFLDLGASVVLCGRSPERLDAALAAPAIARHAERATALPCDLRDPAAVAAMMERIWQDGPLTVLVNNAAANFIAQTERLSARAADAILGPSLHGALYATLEAGRRWIDAGDRGTVLSILSTSARTGRAFTAPSEMAKAGLEAMTKSLAVEWGPKGIRMVAIAPGAFETETAARQLRPGAGDGDEGGFAGLAEWIPDGRLGRTDELADLAAFLLSGPAAHITGETIAIDGGAHLRSSGAEDLLRWPQEKWDAVRQRR